MSCFSVLKRVARVCVVEIDLVQSLCDKRSLGSKLPLSSTILTFEAFNELAYVGD